MTSTASPGATTTCCWTAGRPWRACARCCRPTPRSPPEGRPRPGRRRPTPTTWPGSPARTGRRPSASGAPRSPGWSPRRRSRWTARAWRTGRCTGWRRRSSRRSWATSCGRLRGGSRCRPTRCTRRPGGCSWRATPARTRPSSGRAPPGAPPTCPARRGCWACCCAQYQFGCVRSPPRAWATGWARSSAPGRRPGCTTRRRSTASGSGVGCRAAGGSSSTSSSSRTSPTSRSRGRSWAAPSCPNSGASRRTARTATR